MKLRVCLCALALVFTVTAGIGQPHCARLLCSLDESPCMDGQRFAASLWALDPICNRGGTICYTSDPPGAWFDFPCESFFDVLMVPQTFGPMVGPGEFMPGQCFFLLAHVMFDTVAGAPPIADLWCEEYVCVGSDFRLYRPGDCTPDMVRIPPSMNVSDAFCFKVCHDVYWIPLNCNLPGPPHFTIWEGCLMQLPQCYDPECLLPDPNCYVASWVFCGGIWWLRFEYSCAYRQPVCYCVSFDYQEPVELMSFAAIPGDGEVTLNWATATESNNASFEIGRRASASEGFATIASLPGAGNSATTRYYSWVDENVSNGTTYWYRLTSVDVNGSPQVQGSVVSATPRHGAGTVTEYALRQNYPNPFNAATNIEFDLPAAGWMTLKVYNVAGQEVATVVNCQMSAGLQTVQFDAGDLTSGVYVYTMEVNGFTAQKKMLLIR